MDAIATLFANNRRWSRRMTRKDRRYFRKLSALQKPQFLWIGCSDSRVPANEIVGLLPGELFVHRNIANMVYPDDLNCASVLSYAVEVLRVRHIIVCGHYNCGGVRAVVEGCVPGRTGAWLRDIRETMRRHDRALRKLRTRAARVDRLCELNVLRQAQRVAGTACVRRAMRAGQPLAIHAWIYDLRDGLVRELDRRGPEGAEAAGPHQVRGIRRPVAGV